MFLKKMNKRIKDQDMFGHVINLNYKSHGGTYSTVIGGMFSVVIQIGMFFYVMFHLKTMFNMEDNRLST